MDKDLNNAKIKEVWQPFIEAVKYLIEKKSKQSNRNYVYDSFSSFKNRTFELVSDDKFIDELDFVLKNSENSPHTELMFLEMNSFIDMAGKLKEQNRPKKRPTGYLNDAIGIGKTIIDSLREIGGFSSYVKIGLKIYSESLDIFKGFLSSR